MSVSLSHNTPCQDKRNVLILYILLKGSMYNRGREGLVKKKKQKQ